MTAQDPPDVLVVDAANVVGSRPDGWWTDRVGAAERLLAGLVGVDHTSLSAGRIVVVLEGRAKAAAPCGVPGLELVRAEQDGDSAVVDVVRASGGAVVVTSDRELRRRVEELGARVRGAGWLRALLDGGPPDRTDPGER
ncbi:hypothetical protein Q6348_01295 [Isoptericola sp. b441]|uniref:NTP pyrophosphohydrolase n=1 Tax=Actinotalea lenta TaxID=3064654 RepID=A0ABT9D511_9CELL|nr:MULTISPECIES: hypothetical protein [unclassified Isoptericola]MDO8105829.1 hypothetical protein [Isoptericola sp. b441]MDO8122534.1 hypothetical protein [Isoptericola sp. b490]